MSTRAPAEGMQKYMTNSFSVKGINNSSEDTSKISATSKSPVNGPTRNNGEAKSASKSPNKALIIVTAVSIFVAIVSLAILFAVIFTTKNPKDTNAKVEKVSTEVALTERCQGDRRLLYELEDLCHDARSTDGPVLKCDVVGNNALLQGDATIGNPLEYGYDWEVLTVFRPCDPESNEPKVALSILRCNKLTYVKADEQSLSGVNKSYPFSFENRHYGVAGDTKKTLLATVDASFFSTTQNGTTEMRLLVVLKQTCWSGATKEECNPDVPIIIKNQKIEFGITCPDTDTEKKNRHRRLLEASRRRFLSASQWLNSFCSVSKRIGLYCYVKGNSASLGKTVTILGKRIGVDAALNPCDAYGANIVINFVFEGRKVQLRRLELSRSFTLPIPYLSFAFLGVSAGAVARVSLGGSLAGLSVYLQIDACGSALGEEKCLSDVGAGPVDVVKHVFYIGNACSRRRALGHPDFYFKPTVLQLEPLDLQQFSQQEPQVQVQTIDVPSASKPVQRRSLTNHEDEVTCAPEDALETALDHLCHDARSPHKGPALTCSIASKKVFLVGSTEIGDRLTYGNEFEVAVVLDMCPEDGGDPSAAVSIFINDQPYGTLGDKQTLTGANKQYVLIWDSWREQGVKLDSTVDAAFEYLQKTGEIHLVVTIRDKDLAPQKIYDQIINVDLDLCKTKALTTITTTPARRRLSISPDSWFGAICAQASNKGFYCNRKGSGDDLTVSIGKTIPVLGTSLHVETTIYSPCDPPARAEFVLTYFSQRIPLQMVTLGRTWEVPIPALTVPVLNATASGTATITLKGSLQSLYLELLVDFCAQLGFKRKACTQQLGLGPIRLIKHTFQLGKPLCN